MPLPPPVTQLYLYVMVGQLLYPPYESVYWKSYNTPDLTGLNSGFYGQLQNIAISSTTTIFSPGPSNIPYGPAGGDLAGNYPDPVVIGIDGIPINLSITPTNGQVLVYNSADGYLEYQNQSGSGGGTLSGDVIGPTTANTIHSIQGVVISGAASIGKVLQASSATAASWQLPAGSVMLNGDVTGASNANVVNQVTGSVSNVMNIAVTGSATINLGTGEAASINIGQASSSIELSGSVQVAELAGFGDGYVGVSNFGVLYWSAGPTGEGSSPTGAAGGDLQGTYPNPQVKSISGSVDGYVAIASPLSFGTFPATTGEIRLPSDTFIYARNNLNNANLNLIGSSGTSTLYVGDSGDNGAVLQSFDVEISSLAGFGDGYVAVSNTGVLSWSAGPSDISGPAGGDLGGTYPNPTVVDISGAAGVVNIRSTGNILTWAAATTAPGIQQTIATSGAGQAMSFYAQSAAVGSNANGGTINITGGSGDGTGVGGNFLVQTGDGFSSITGTSLGGNGFFYLHAAGTSGQVLTRSNAFIIEDVSNGVVVDFANNHLGASSMTIGGAVTSYTIGQTSTATTFGAPLSITAQGATGAGHNGGLLTLSSGSSGSATAGNLWLQTGGTTQIAVSPTTVTLTSLAGSGSGYVAVNNTGVLSFATGIAPSGSAGGDLSGTYPNPTVAKIQGIAVSATAPTTNQVLEYNGTSYVPTSLPSALPPNGSAGGDLTGSYPNPTVHSIQGVVISGTPSAGQVLTATSSTAADWATGSGSVTMLGDVTGASNSNTVVQLTGSGGGGGNVSVLANALTWSTSAGSPIISQASTSGSFSNSMNLIAQNNVGSGIGGNLFLSSGLSTSTVAGKVEIEIGGTSQISFTPTSLQPAQSAITLTDSDATYTLSAAQKLTPMLVLSCALTAGNSPTIAFGGVVGFYWIDCSGLTFSGWDGELIFTNGAGSCNTASQGLTMTPHTLFFVNCATTSTITLG